VRGSGFEPTTSAKAALGLRGAMKAAFGLRFPAAFLVVFFVVVFLFVVFFIILPPKKLALNCNYPLMVSAFNKKVQTFFSAPLFFWGDFPRGNAAFRAVFHWQIPSFFAREYRVFIATSPLKLYFCSFNSQKRQTRQLILRVGITDKNTTFEAIESV